MSMIFPLINIKNVEYVPVEYPSTQEIMANLHELEMGDYKKSGGAG